MARAERAAADPSTRVIVWDIRLPQALMAALVGAALGLAGAEMQTILNNPLASPFTLGVSSAAAFGASLAIVLNLGLPGVPAGWLIAGNAFLFAALAALALDAAARRAGMNTQGVVLFGIAMVFSFNALVSLVQFVASAEALQNLVFWTMGSLSRSSWASAGALAAVALALPLALRQSWKLTALRLGEERAASFGVDVRRVRVEALARVSLLSALSVAFVGTIGFIGLVAPHIARRLFGEDHRYYLPGSALTGATILSLASLASKNLMPGVIIPVGIVTSLVGIPSSYRWSCAAACHDPASPCARDARGGRAEGRLWPAGRAARAEPARCRRRTHRAAGTERQRQVHVAQDAGGPRPRARRDGAAGWPRPCDGRSGRTRAPRRLPAARPARRSPSAGVRIRAGGRPRRRRAGALCQPAEIETLLERLGIAPWPCIIWTRSRAGRSSWSAWPRP